MKEKLTVLANLLHFRIRYLEACHDAKLPYTATKVEALVDMGNGIDNYCPVTDVLYDPVKKAVILYIDGRDLEY